MLLGLYILENLLVRLQKINDPKLQGLKSDLIEQVISTLSSVCYSIPVVLDKLVAKLDKRANDHIIATKCDFKEKEWVKKSPSKFTVPGNVPKWTLSSITQAGTKRQIIADEPSDAGEATPNRNFTGVPVTPRRTSKAKRQVVDISDDKAAIVVHSSEGWSAQLGN